MAVLGPPGPLLGLLGASWGPWGASWGPPGASWGASWGLLGASWGGELDFSVRVRSLGPLLGPSWGSPGPSWAPLGPFWRSPGPSRGSPGDLLGRLGPVFGASWAVSERRKAEKARRPKSSNIAKKINEFGLSGLSRGSSGSLLACVGGRYWVSGAPLMGLLGASWALLGVSRGGRPELMTRASSLGHL